MAIIIGQHEFEGPVKTFTDVPATPGLFALLHGDPAGFMLVDIQQSENLTKSLTESYASLNSQAIVILPCINPSKRKAILTEIIREFEFEEDDLVLEVPKRRRTETNTGIALSINC